MGAGDDDDGMQPDSQLHEVIQRHVGSRGLGEVAGIRDLLPQPVP